MTKIANKTPSPLCDPGSAERQKVLEQKRAQLAKNGITDAQRRAGHGWLSQRLYDQIQPLGYIGGKAALRQMAHDVLLNPPAREPMNSHTREDAWATYLGLSQPFGTLQISNDVPSKGRTSVDTEYYRFKNMDHSDERVANAALRLERAYRLRGDDRSSYVFQDGYFRKLDESKFGPLGNFTMSVGSENGQEYVSYYDEWDLDPTLWGVQFPAELVAGHPFQVYGRIPFDRSKAERVMELEDEILARGFLQPGVGATGSKEEIKALIRRSVEMNDPKGFQSVGVSEAFIPRMLEELQWSFQAGLPEEIRPLAEELSRLDPRYADPKFAPDAWLPTPF